MTIRAERALPVVAARIRVAGFAEKPRFHDINYESQLK
jgi:hypothetical protein